MQKKKWKKPTNNDLQNTTHKTKDRNRDELRKGMQCMLH